MRNIKLVVSYDGGDFHGWQSQPGMRTVQQTMQEALANLIQESVFVNASGRTDTGVHAVGQVVNFRTSSSLPIAVFVRGLNAHLPEDVVIRSAEEMPESFDANRDARRKLYRYIIHDEAVPNLFMRRYSHHSRYRLDVAVMARAAARLRGQHDFACFETEWPNRASSVRTITYLALNRMGPWIWLDVEADGFLYNMVRAIAGTLIDVGRGHRAEDQIDEILASRDRAQAGPTAPAQGLYLMRVTYETAEHV